MKTGKLNESVVRLLGGDNLKVVIGTENKLVNLFTGEIITVKEVVVNGVSGFDYYVDDVLVGKLLNLVAHLNATSGKITKLSV